MAYIRPPKHEPHIDDCKYCNQRVLWFWRRGWIPLDTDTGQRHHCPEFWQHPERRNGPVSSRPATSEELEGLSQTK